MKPVAETSKRDRSETEKRLVEVALAMMERDGVLGGLNLRKVAEAAGVNRGNIYHYFGTRRELLRAAINSQFKTLVRTLSAKRRGKPFIQRRLDAFLPSQFMENFCWDWTVIKEISVGDEGGDHLPEEVFKKMLDAKHFMSGIQTLRQVEFALFDLRVHMEGHIEQIKDVYTILDSVREQVSVLQVPEYNQFPNSFSHIFAGGYAAGYYSYKWAEVLSADVYAMSRDAGLSISQLGRRFLDDILSIFEYLLYLFFTLIL